ncbi:hypothetical protein BDQ17DRAFT_1437187 [Cyathus striatus]|nr:hypothetical protein BDQ17DRAFT_1437187 [Cyathus striatus]
MAPKVPEDFFFHAFSNHVSTLEGLQSSLPDSVPVGTRNDRVATIFAKLPVPAAINEYWERYVRKTKYNLLIVVHLRVEDASELPSP